MSRTGGEKTRAKILQAAAKLFARNGFDATSVDSIAKAASVNKALIYYHFNDKRDLIASLFSHILQQLQAQAAAATAPSSEAGRVRQELVGLQPWKGILSVMLMEALKSSAQSEVLFECATLSILSERGETSSHLVQTRRGRKALVHDFFTGFIPIVTFAAMQQKFCKHFGCDPTEALDDFVEAFEQSHLAGHKASREGARNAGAAHAAGRAVARARRTKTGRA